jgi:hypothetical protein
VTPEERRFLPAMITQIPLHWVATAWIMDSVPEAESDGRGRGVVGTPRGIDVVVRPGRGASRFQCTMSVMGWPPGLPFTT